MAHIDIPIHFRFLKVPVDWEVTDHRGLGPILHGRLKEWRSPDEIKLSELQGWQCREKFFGVLENDVDGLANFFNKVGVWDWSPTDWSETSRYVHPEDVWAFRTDLKTALLYPKSYLASVAPDWPNPKTLLDLYSQPHPANVFPLSFELAKVAEGLVSIANARQMLSATVFADLSRKIRFKSCRRRDCQKPFPIESEHTRKFCSQYCGHLVSQRRQRALRKKTRAKLQK
jgi:hypothetical protein